MSLVDEANDSDTDCPVDPALCFGVSSDKIKDGHEASNSIQKELCNA